MMAEKEACQDVKFFEKEGRLQEFRLSWLFIQFFEKTCAVLYTGIVSATNEGNKRFLSHGLCSEPLKLSRSQRSELRVSLDLY